MKRLIWLVAAIVSAVGASPLTMAYGDMVTEWNSLAIAAIKADMQTATRASRSLAMVHAAMYDAVNAIEKTHQAYYVAAEAIDGSSSEAAAAASAHEVLVSLYPSQRHSLDLALERLLADLPDGAGKTNGVALGEYVGGQIVAWRASDHSADMVPYTPGTGPGVWRPTPPSFAPAMTPQWAIVTPFAMTDCAQFRTKAPPPLTSAEYATYLNEVKSLGAKNSTTRTPEQTIIANFWMDMPGTATTVGRWNLIAQSVADQKSNTFSENARLFALLNIAMADAGITAWNYKFYYNFWRPITAIREADTDGNPDTAKDPMWMPLIMTPAFQEHVSAHSTFSAAAATVLEYYFGTEGINFTIYDFMMPASGRAYASFSAAAEEAGASRIYGGIHFTSANLDGLSSGRSVAEYVTQNFLAPNAVQGPLAISLDTASASAGMRFSLNFELRENISTPADVYIVADTPYGLLTIYPGGKIIAGARAVYKNISGISAPIQGSLMREVVIPQGIAAGTYCFCCVIVDAGMVPPVSSIYQIADGTPYVCMHDMAQLEIR